MNSRILKTRIAITLIVEEIEPSQGETEPSIPLEEPKSAPQNELTPELMRWEDDGGRTAS